MSALHLPGGLATAGFDSASGLLRALGRFLHGRDFPLLGMAPGALEPGARAAVRGLEALPRSWRQQLYAVGGWAEAVPPSLLGRVRAEALAGWCADHHPERRFPALLIGSSNGAAMHLAAAMGVPWLPQTLLIPVRQGGEVHDIDDAMARGLAPGRRLLGVNPSLQLHHMHDPNQDLLMSRGMAYFRVKMRQLPEAYRRFVEERLEPGAPIIVVDCGFRWPTTEVGDRHLFQNGAYGGMAPEDYRQRWGGPQPDGTSPEAEWGYEPALDHDLRALGDRHPLRWLRFEDPEDLSPVVAELHRDWHRRLGRPTTRLLAESFLAVEPHWAQRTASVPYWMAFSIRRSMERLGRWLDHGDAFDEIRMTLMPHGVESVGVAERADWRAVLDRARKVGTLLGSDEDRFPVDFGSLVRYHGELTRIRHRFPLPPPMAVDDALRFVGELGSSHGVELTDAPRAVSRCGASPSTTSSARRWPGPRAPTTR